MSEPHGDQNDQSRRSWPTVLAWTTTFAACGLFTQMPEAVFTILNPQVRPHFEVNLAWLTVAVSLVLAIVIGRRFFKAIRQEHAPARRWFRFSLRTMFVAVTVFGIWLGWNANQVTHRTALARLIESRGGTLSEQSYTGCLGREPPIVWSFLGDKPARYIVLPEGKFSATEAAEIQQTFFEGLTFWPERPRQSDR